MPSVTQLEKKHAIINHNPTPLIMLNNAQQPKQFNKGMKYMPDD
jgi:hypothetical protein